MTHGALIRIAPIFDLKRDLHPDKIDPDRIMYSRGSLTLRGDAPPVLIGHDDDRPIGVVRKLIEFDDTDGRWIAASCRIDKDKAPAWLRGGRNGTRASFRIATLQRTTFHDVTRVLRGLVSEVSVLPPGVEPAEPLASVAWFGPAPTAQPPKIIRRAAHIQGDEELAELRRRLDWFESHGRDVPFALVFENMKRELEIR